MTCGVVYPYGADIACTLPAGHDGEHEHRAHGAHTQWRDIHDEQQARHDALVASAKGTFARKYPGVVKWLPVDLDAVQRETNRVVERVHAAQATPPPLTLADVELLVAARDIDLVNTPPLTLADVERIATEAAHDVNPHIGVCVDAIVIPPDPFEVEHGRARPGWLVVLSLAGERAERSLWVAGELYIDARHLAAELCEAVGRAWRPSSSVVARGGR